MGDERYLKVDRLDQQNPTDKLLNISISSFFARDQYIKPALNRMQDGGIYKLKDLISRSKTEIFSAYHIGPSNQKKITHLLQGFGLDFHR